MDFVAATLSNTLSIVLGIVIGSIIVIGLIYICIARTIPSFSELVLATLGTTVGGFVLITLGVKQERPLKSGRSNRQPSTSNGGDGGQKTMKRRGMKTVWTWIGNGIGVDEEDWCKFGRDLEKVTGKTF